MSETSAAADGRDPLGRDTIPKYIAYNAQHRRDRPAMREKDLGIWQSWTWGEVAGKVRQLACGLAAAGLGCRLAVPPWTRPPGGSTAILSRC